MLKQKRFSTSGSFSLKDTKLPLRQSLKYGIAFALIFSLSGCGSDTKTNKVENTSTPSASKKPFSAADPEQFEILTLPATEKSPEFPTSITDYQLETTVENQSIRIFSHEDWTPFLDRYKEGNSLSCQPEVYVVRWRAVNPGIQLKVAFSYLSAEYGYNEDSGWMGFAPIDTKEFQNATPGSTGFIRAASCSSPFFKWNSDDGSATLVDVYFEYQIWTFKPKI